MASATSTNAVETCLDSSLVNREPPFSAFPESRLPYKVAAGGHKRCARPWHQCTILLYMLHRLSVTMVATCRLTHRRRHHAANGTLLYRVHSHLSFSHQGKCSSTKLASEAESPTYRRRLWEHTAERCSDSKNRFIAPRTRLEGGGRCLCYANHPRLSNPFPGGPPHGDCDLLVNMPPSNSMLLRAFPGSWSSSVLKRMSQDHLHK